MPPLASLVFLSYSRSLTSPRYRAFPPASQAARSLMAREKQMPPSASRVFLSCSRSLTSPRCRALPPASQAARSLMAREKQMPPSASLVFLSCSLYHIFHAMTPLKKALHAFFVARSACLLIEFNMPCPSKPSSLQAFRSIHRYRTMFPARTACSGLLLQTAL